MAKEKYCLYDDFVKFLGCLFFFCLRCVIRQLPTMPHHGKIDCLSEERRDGRPKFHRPLQLLNRKRQNIKPKHDMEAGVWFEDTQKVLGFENRKFGDTYIFGKYVRVIFFVNILQDKVPPLFAKEFFFCFLIFFKSL